MKYNHKRPVEDFKEQIQIIKDNGFNPIGVSQVYFEDSFIFNTAKEAKLAYNLLEQDKFLVTGWWYSKKQFEKIVNIYEKDSLEDNDPIKVLIHWL